MRLACVLATALAPATPALAQCPFTASATWTPSEGAPTKLFRHGSVDAYYFVASRMAIDADGAPNAYNPENTGIDYNANAGYPKTEDERKARTAWRSIIVPDPANPDQGYVQPDGAFKGYFVSMTSLEDASKPATDPARYVDSSDIPYLAFPGNFLRMAGTGNIGDVGLAIRREDGKATPFIVADKAPAQHPLGEVSIAMARELGSANPSPKTGVFPSLGDVAYVIFRNSREQPAWPVTKDAIAAKVNTLAASIGGVDAIRACIADEANR